MSVFIMFQALYITAMHRSTHGEFDAPLETRLSWPGHGWIDRQHCRRDPDRGGGGGRGRRLNVSH